MISPSTLAKEYQVISQLGEGSFGSVYLVEDEKGKRCALKRIQSNAFTREQSLKQILVMKKLQHQNLIKIYDYSFNHDTDIIEIIMEYCQEGDLFRYYKRRSRNLSVTEILEIFKQIVQAFIAMNVKGVFHRDLKPENILISKGMVVKIADFGCAKSVQTVEISKIDNFSLDKGTPIYASPQQLMNQKYSFKCDVWSAGVILYFIYYGHHPFMDAKAHNTLSKIKELTQGKEIQLKQDSDPTIAKIIGLTLIYEEKQRASWRELWLSRLFSGKAQSMTAYIEYLKNITIIANWMAKQFWKCRKNYTFSKNRDQVLVYFLIKFQCTGMLQAREINKHHRKWQYLFTPEQWAAYKPTEQLKKETKQIYHEHQKYFVTIKKSMESKQAYNIISQRQAKRKCMFNDLINSINSGYKFLYEIKDQLPSKNDVEQVGNVNDYKIWVFLARWINFERWFSYQKQPRIEKLMKDCDMAFLDPKRAVIDQLSRFEEGIVQ